MANSINDVLDELQKIPENNEEALSHWCQKLVAFYEENQRHSYSEITKYIIECGGIDYVEDLIPKLAALKKSEHFDEAVKPKIEKLIDHLNLEIVRIRYINQLITDNTMQAFVDLNNQYSDEVSQSLQSLTRKSRTIEQGLLEINKKNAATAATLKDHEEKSNSIIQHFDELQKNSNEISSSLDKTKRKIKNLQNESIAVLGIFSAVVLSFVGGLAFSTSVLQNIHKASIYRLSFIVVIIGIVLFNVIWALMDFIMTFCERGSLDKFIFITVNAILVGLLIFSVIAYAFQIGGFEQHMTDTVTKINQSQTEWTAQ